MHKKSQNYLPNNTVPDTVVPCTLNQAPVFLAFRIRRLSVTSRYTSKPLSVVSFVSSRFSDRCAFLHRAPEFGQHWRTLLTPSGPELVPLLPTENLGNFSLLISLYSGALLTGIVLRAPTMGERDFFFLKKRRGKNVSRIIFSTPANTPPCVSGYALQKYPL